MNRRLVALAGAALTAVAVVAAVAIPATSGTAGGTTAAAPDGSGGAPAAIVNALQRDLNLTADQARTRLSNEAKASGTELRLRKLLGSAFGGAYLSADAATFTVAVTTEAAATRVRSEGATPRIVRHSEKSLDALRGKLDTNGSAAPDSVAGWYVDPASNSVVVVAATRAVGDAFIAGSGARNAAVRVLVSAESPRPLIDVIGGNAYFIGGGRCSVGFSVNGGFVTAGHCGNVGSNTTQPSGTFRGSSFPGNDYAWVQVAAGNTPRGIVNMYPGSVTVSGSQEAATGASICRSGSTTGWHCGTIQAKNATVNYPQGTVTGLTRTNVCAEPGDSGGSWMSGSQAQGVTSGGSGNCSSGGTTFFQPVNEILSAFSLTLVTGGGGGTTPPPPPPPPGACSSFPNVYTGTLSSGANQYQPNGSYYQSTTSGAHQGCLDAASSSVDFDLYLQKWNGFGWSTVASGTSPGPDESFTYNGTSGYYRYRVHAYSGSGSYTLGIRRP